MQILGRSETAGLQHQALRRGLQFLAGSVEGLEFDAVLVGTEQQGQRQRFEGLGQLAGFQLVDVLRLHQRLLLLLFQTGLSRLQRSQRRRLVAALALLVKINRRRMQAQQQAGRFVRQRRVAEILGAQFGETELVFACDFPQEIEVDVLQDGLRLLQQLGRGRRCELQHHVLGLDLGALAGSHFDLIGLALLRQHGASLEIAGFFKK